MKTNITNMLNFSIRHLQQVAIIIIFLTYTTSVFAGGGGNDDDWEGEASVTVKKTGNGTIYIDEPKKTINQNTPSASFSLKAIPDENNVFMGWSDSENGTISSTDNPLTITLTGSKDSSYPSATYFAKFVSTDITLKCDAIGYTFAKLSWTNIAEAESYILYDNNIEKGRYSTNSATLTGLDYGSSHKYTVKSVIGNTTSNPSNTVEVTTPAYPQVQNVHFSNVQQNQVTVNWNPVTNLPTNHSLVCYHVHFYENAAGTGTTGIGITTTETSYTFTGLIDNTQYTAYVDVEYQYTLNGETKNVMESRWSSAAVTTTSFIPTTPFDGAELYKGIWYRVNLNSEIRINDGYLDDEDKPYEMNLLYPCEPKVDFQINTSSAIGIYGDATIKIDETRTDNWENIHTKSYRGKNQSGTSNTSGHDIKALKFYCDGGNNANEYIHDIWLTIAPHILLNKTKYITITTETATQTTEAVVDFGTIEIGDSKPINIDFKSFLSVGEIKALLTDTTNSDIFWLNSVRGTKEYHIAGNNTLEKINTNDHNFTISFNPTVAGNHDGAIIIKDDKHTITLKLKATCIKKTPEITWINDKYISIGEILSGAATSTYGTVKYESLNNDIIAVENNTLESKSLGSTKIIAIVEENDKWYAAKDTATFIVTDKIIQTIEWNQDFTTLTTNSQINELTARAITRATEEENGNEITYSTIDSTESIIKIIDGKKLQIVGPGFTYITAHQQGNDEYAPTYVTKLVFVRKLSGGCDDYFALEYAGETFGDGEIISSGFNWGPFVIEKELETIGEKLSFTTTKVTGQTFNTTGDKLTITDDLGNIIYNNNLGKTETDIPINRDAKKLIFTLEGNLKVSISNIKVTPAIYLEADHNAINFSSTEVDLNAIEEVVFDWANQPDYAWATIIDDPNGVFSVDNKTAIFGSSDCGKYGSTPIKVIFSPKKEINYTAKLAVYVGENIETPKLIIPITGKGAKAKQEIYWLNYPLSTADKEINIAQTTALTQQPITYKILSGNDVAIVNNNNTITILKEGKFTLSAIQEGNNSYQATKTIQKEFTTTIGNLIFDNKTGDKEWFTAENWKPNSKLNLNRNITPDENVNLSITAPLVISNNREIVIEKEITLSNNGSITIAPKGKLKANNINGATAENLTLQADENGSAILLFKNDESNKVNATVELYSLASSDGLRNGQAGNFKDPKWQYLGIAAENIEYSTLNPNGTSNWIYRWDETQNATSCWAEKLTSNSTLSAWIGYCLAQETATTYNYSGSLLNADHTYNLTYTPENASDDLGNNLITNSYTAPIDITTLNDANFQNAKANIYIYKTGSYLEWKEQTTSEGFNAGQVIVIPVNTISILGNEYPRTIASMQAFFVNATAKEASFSINYENNVYNSLRKENQKRNKSLETGNNFNVLKIQMNSSTSNDRLYLLEHENTTDKFDNGYDAEKIFDNTNGPQIYATTPFGCASICTNESFDGQTIGFVANNENEIYTMTFEIDKLHSYEELYLYDTETGIYVDIIAEESYQFYASTAPNNKRFQITSTRLDAPQGPTTTIENTTTWNDILQENQPIYIYSITGQLITTYNSKFYIQSLQELHSQLAVGVYIVKSGNKTMKIIIENK